MLNTSLKSCTQLNIGRLQFDCSMICIVLFFNYFMQLINLIFFWYCIHMLVNLVLQASNESFWNNRFSFAVTWIHFNSTIMHTIIDPLQSSQPWSSHILSDWRPDLSKNFWNAVMIAISLLSMEQPRRSCCKYQWHIARIWLSFCTACTPMNSTPKMNILYDF